MELLVRLTRLMNDRTRGRARVIRGEHCGVEVSFGSASTIPSNVRSRSLVRMYGEWSDPGVHFVALGEPSIMLDFTPADLQTLLEHDLAGFTPESLHVLLQVLQVPSLHQAMRVSLGQPEIFRATVSDAVGAERAEAIMRFFRDLGRDTDLANVSRVLHQLIGVDTPAAVRAYDLLSPRTRREDTTVSEALQRNPWLIAQVDGLSFQDAERLAAAMQIRMDPLSDRKRIAGAVMSALWRETRRGHSYMALGSLLGRTAGLLRLDPNAKTDLVMEVIMGLTNADTVQGGLTMQRFPDETKTLVYLKGTYFAERTVGTLLAQMVAEPVSDPLSPEHLSNATRRLTPRLTAKQVEAVALSGMNRLVIVHGSAGTGKSDVSAALCRVYEDQFGIGSVRIMAPIAIAALRTAARVGLSLQHSGTVHRMVSVMPEEDDLAFRPELPPLEAIRKQLTGAKLIILEEFGLCSLYLINRILRAIPQGVRLVLVGDPGQAPPIGPGGVIESVILHPRFAQIRVELTTQFRYAGVLQSNALAVREGRACLAEEPGSFEIEDVRDPGLILDRVMALARTEPEALVMSPRYAGNVGVEMLNLRLRAIWTPNSVGSDQRLVPGDRVVARENKYVVDPETGQKVLDVANGLPGLVIAVTDRLIQVSFHMPDGTERERTYTDVESDQMLMWFNATVPWKIQGWEGDCVIFVWSQETDLAVLDRRVLYTVITRARRRVILIGPREKWAEIIEQRHGERRSKLTYWLSQPPRPERSVTPATRTRVVVE